ncbi:hypothetical protein CCMSSC00406_0008366 [Pleurotus cornucopiae]|uniref:Uncharacterized protein n=1 Tax=Pleurotus cornucopiae TaxID=5321 RepID=A0ACB7J8Y0_PLECO|nr:hypothetical protein CCMSSC00406_0008366 [Pleurotus cornucopiae]
MLCGMSFFSSLVLAVCGLLTTGVAAQSFTNPSLYTDLADLMVIRVNDTFYYSSSTMHYSPGAPILRSYDLVNWEFIGHSVPTLSFGDNDSYNLVNGKRAYVRGIWASFFNYRASTNTWFWGGCVDFDKTYIYTASSPTGPWTQRSIINKCYYDSSLLVDDDGSLYVAYGSSTISVAKLSADGLSEVSSQVVYTTDLYIEGSRFYKVNGRYYIFVTHPAAEEHVLMSTGGPMAQYTIKPLALSVRPPIAGTGNPHQGGLVTTPSGDSYYIAFIDSYPAGRVPVLAPLTWGSDGFPVLQLVNGGWGASYPVPMALHPLPSLYSTDSFSGTNLKPEWDWNHNPDTSKFRVNNGLFLDTVTVANDLYAARNTLTHRIPGPESTATIAIDVGSMRDGDRAGLALFRDASAWIGVARTGSSYAIWFVNNLTMDSAWNTVGRGTTVATANVTGGTIYLRINARVASSSDRVATFYYSTTGSTFTSMGTFTMITAWQYFMGYRFGLFNYATLATGGTVKINYFDIQGRIPSSVPIITSSSSAPTPTGGSGTVAQHGQCGGSGYTGPTGEF